MDGWRWRHKCRGGIPCPWALVTAITLGKVFSKDGWRYGFLRRWTSILNPSSSRGLITSQSGDVGQSLWPLLSAPKGARISSNLETPKDGESETPGRGRFYLAKPYREKVSDFLHNISSNFQWLRSIFSVDQFMRIHLDQRLANGAQRAKLSSLPVLVNEVSLTHSHCHSFSTVWLLQGYHGRAE